MLETLRRGGSSAIAAIAQDVSGPGEHLHGQLGCPVPRDLNTTFHLRWWNDRDRSLTPRVNGELEVRPLATDSTQLVITVDYRCRARLRELADSMFIRRTAESVVNAFLHALVDYLERATEAQMRPDWSARRNRAPATCCLTQR
ncbi:MAG: hypothetical protein ABI289_15130 [Candidatus Dormibacter sp.]